MIARNLLLVALVGAVLAGGAVVTAQDYSPIPGSDFMNRGINVIDGTQLDEGGSKALLPIFTLHYTMGQTWSPPDSDVKFAIPDEMAVTTDQSHHMVTDEGLATSYSDYVHSVRTSFSVSAGVKIDGNKSKAFSGNFKYDRESQKMKEEISNSSSASGLAKNVYSYYSLASYPPQFLTLNPILDRSISGLPSTISNAADQKKYNDIIRFWGSHYVQEANFGGKINVDTFLSSSYANSKSQSFLSQQFSLNFHYNLFDLSTGGFKNRSDIKLDESFKHEAKTDLYFYGGDPMLADNTTLPQWLNSLSQNAHYLNCTIADITELFPDDKEAQRKVMQGVIKSYVEEGELPAEVDA